MYDLDKKYMVSHLTEYVAFQQGQGYDLEDIKGALINYGYDNGLVKSIIDSAAKNRFDAKKHKKVVHKEMDRDLYLYVQNLLVDYIKKELDSGYSMDAIRKALIRFGHRPDMVRQAALNVSEGRVVELKEPTLKKEKEGSQMVFLLSMLIGLIFIAFMSISTDSSVITVLVSFSPLLVSLILSNIIFRQSNNRTVVLFLPLLSVLIAVGIYIAILQVSAIIRLADHETILMLNSVLSFILVAANCTFTRKIYRLPEKKPVEKTEPAVEEEKLEEDVEEFLKEDTGSVKEKKKAAAGPKSEKKELLKIKEF